MAPRARGSGCGTKGRNPCQLREGRAGTGPGSKVLLSACHAWHFTRPQGQGDRGLALLRVPSNKETFTRGDPQDYTTRWGVHRLSPAHGARVCRFKSWLCPSQLGSPFYLSGPHFRLLENGDNAVRFRGSLGGSSE